MWTSWLAWISRSRGRIQTESDWSLLDSQCCQFSHPARCWRRGRSWPRRPREYDTGYVLVHRTNVPPLCQSPGVSVIVAPRAPAHVSVTKLRVQAIHGSMCGGAFTLRTEIRTGKNGGCTGKYDYIIRGPCYSQSQPAIQLHLYHPIIPFTAIAP